MPPADDQHVPPDLHRAAQAGLAEELQRADHAPGLAARRVQPAADVLAEGEEDRVVAAGQLVQGPAVRADPDAAADLDAAQVQQLGDLSVEDLLGQVPGGDAGPQHAPGLVQGLEDDAGVALAAQVVGAAEAAGTRAHDGHRLAVQRGQVLLDRVVRELQAEVPEEPLDPADADRLVVRGPVAGGLAGVVADPAGDRGHRIVLEDRQVAVQVPVVLDVIQVLLDLLAGRAGVVARRRLVPVHRPVEAEVAGREQPLPLLLGGRRRDARDRQPEVLGNVRPAYGHGNLPGLAGACGS